jgi:hypothetical protein
MFFGSPTSRPARGSHSCSTMPANPGCVGCPPTEPPRWFHNMLSNHLRPSSSWNSEGSKPEALTNTGSLHGPSMRGAVTM